MKETTEQVNPATAGCGMVYVGVDVSKDTLAIDAGGHYVGVIQNSKSALAKAVRAIRKSAGGKEARIMYVIEHTGCYSLLVHIELAKSGEAVCVADPKRIRHFAKMMHIAAKSDPLDAKVIRRFAEFMKPDPTPLPDDTLLELREIINGRSLLAKARAMLSVLTGTTRSEACRSALNAVLVAIDRQVEKLEAKLLEAFDRADETTRRKVAEIEKIKAVGRLTAITVVTAVPEIGTLGPRRAAAIAGLAPFVRQSGKWKGHPKISAGRSEVRRALYMPAVCASTYNEVLRKTYRHLVLDKHKPRKVAITAVMRKLIVHMDRVAASVLSSSGTPIAK